MKEEIRIFFTSLMFYTRIPCPKHVDHSPDYINKATRYFPLIGWIVGLGSFAVYWAAAHFFGDSIALVLSLLCGVLMTGAFHEDGLADVFDGFGGGWTKSKILEIMKDSRVGTFGALALILNMGLKFLVLDQLISQPFLSASPMLIALIFVNYHALARWASINIIFTSVYSREDEQSKAKPISKDYSMKEVIGVYFFGLLPLLILSLWHWPFALVVVPLIVVKYYAEYFFNKWIDGYTGDCLGAVEQVAEGVCLLFFLAVCRFM